MDIVKARETVLWVVEQRKRWGNKLSPKDFSFEDMMDALVTVYDHDNESTAAVNTEVIKANKEAGAAKARATRAQGFVDELRAANEKLEKKADAQLQVIQEYEKQIAGLKAQVEAKS